MSSDFTALRVRYPDCANPLSLAAVKKEQQQNAAAYAELLEDAPALRGILVLYDADIDLQDDSLVLWKAFNNVDPRRDIRRTRWGLLIDATRKGPADGHTRPWPDDIVMSDAIIKLVDEKFPEFGKG